MQVTRRLGNVVSGRIVAAEGSRMPAIAGDPHFVRFGGFALDLRLGELTNNDNRLLPPITFRILALLVRSPGRQTARSCCASITRRRFGSKTRDQARATWKSRGRRRRARLDFGWLVAAGRLWRHVRETLWHVRRTDAEIRQGLRKAGRPSRQFAVEFNVRR